MRKVVGLGAFLVLFGPVSCLSDEGPKPFTTAGSCYPGDLQDCTCESSNGSTSTGVQTCGPDQQFVRMCRCEKGCTVYPDCSSCGASCVDTCICQTAGNAADCSATCAAETGK
jgi:hypothetical protein